MDIESLKTFLILANTKNYTRTAEQLFLSQSTITNRIKELEKELNVLLFSRNNRSVELTLEGEQFLIYAEKVVELTNSSLTEITSLRKFKNYIRIGCSDSIYESHLASALLKHQRENPDDAIKITIGLSSHLIKQLQDGIFDVVFSYLPLKNKAFYCELFKQDSMVLVTDHKNTKYIDGITKEELIKVNYFMCNFALQDVGQFIRNLFPKYHQFQLEIDDCSKVIPFLFQQEAYTFLPKDMASFYINSKQLRAIPLIKFNIPVINSYLICRKQKWDLYRDIFL